MKQNAKKNYKKIENRKMYLQVVHYYDQRAQTPAAIIHASAPEERTKTLQGRSLEKQNKGPERFVFSSLICYTDQNQMSVP